MQSGVTDMVEAEAFVSGLDAEPVAADISKRAAFALPRVLRDLFLYGLCSAAALGLDCGLLYVLTREGLGYLPSAAISFFAGMLLAYYFSVHFIFDDRRSLDWKREAAGFFIIGALGLLLNQAILFAAVGGLGLSLALAKIISAGFVFLFNFAGRRSMLFSLAAQRPAIDRAH